MPARPSPLLVPGMASERANAGGRHEDLTPLEIKLNGTVDEALTALENTSLNAGSASRTAPAACGPERDIFGAANSNLLTPDVIASSQPDCAVSGASKDRALIAEVGPCFFDFQPDFDALFNEIMTTPNRGDA